MTDSGSPADVVHAFVEAINARNIDALTALMTDDHLFIDSMGETIRGKHAMRNAWIAYSVMVPDYRITVAKTFVRDTSVALFGRAGGTFSTDGTLQAHNRWENHAAWMAEVRSGKIALWQIFADNEPMRAIIARSGKSGKESNPRPV